MTDIRVDCVPIETDQSKEKNPVPVRQTAIAGLGFDRRWLIAAGIVIVGIMIGQVLAGTNWILIAALLILPIVLIRPREVCLGVYAFLLPFDSLSAVGPEGITLTLLAGAGLIVVLLGTALMKRELQRPPRQLLPWTLFVAWSIVTGLWALDGQNSLIRLPTAISLIVLFLVALSTSITRKELRTASFFAIAGATAASIYLLYQYFGGPVGARGSIGTGDTAADPNYLAASLLLPLALSIHGFLTARGLARKLVWLSVDAVITFGILVTGSRGSMVAVVVMLMFFMYTRLLSRRLMIPLLALFVAIPFFLPDAFFNRLETTVDTGGAGRTIIWQGGLVAFVRHPFMGAGLNNFGNAYRDNVGSAPLYHGRMVYGAHNVYLEVAVEMGVAGIVLLLAGMIGQMRAANRCRKKLSPQPAGVLVAYEAGCYAIMTAAFFIGVTWEKWFWLPWMLLALAVRTAPVEEIATPVKRPTIRPWEDVRIESAPELGTR